MSDTPDAGTAGQPNAADSAADVSAERVPLRLLKKAEFLGRSDVQYLDVPVPEWAEDGVIPIVRIKTLTNTEKEEFENAIAKQGADGIAKTEIRGLRAKFLVKVIVDEEGKRVFDDSDAAALGQKSSSAIGRLFDAGTRHNRMFSTGLEDAVKN